jgi:hypothetical protein
MIFNLGKSVDNISKQGAPNFRLWIANIRDVDVDNWPKAVNATISTNVLLAGRTHKYLDVKADTIKANAQPGESPINGKLILTPIYEGISRDALNWVYSNAGEDVIVIWERCADKQRFIGGSPCSSGLRVKYTSIGDQDGGIAGIALSFEGGECPEPFFFYDGPIITGTPQIVPADATTFVVSEKDQYQLSDNTSATALASITGVDDDDVGRIIELIGYGVNFPTTVAPSATFILRNGVAWSASQGSKLSLQIVKTGANAYAFYEVARS